MAGRRIERLNEQLKREITELLRTEVRDPRVGAATVTGVEASPDLSYARVHVTSLGGADRRDEMLEGLNAASAYIRGELGRRLRVRRVPELDFRWDATLEHAQRIERLIDEMQSGRTTDVPGGDEEGRGRSEPQGDDG